MTITKCIICGSDGRAYCSKCKTQVCSHCHKPVGQVYCELCLEKLPNHKTDCYNKMRFSYIKSDHLPVVYQDLNHQRFLKTK
ncbi:MAG: hypothetical protein KGI25_06110 [Thaumarchaeota archaeon]|nr:hypothetical protein [Nitrososphaerota archaeon]